MKPVILSRDGSVRLTFTTFAALRFEHLVSGLDAQAQDGGYEGGTVTVLSGYTEWVRRKWPAISVGWDGRVPAVSSHGDFERASSPRSDVLLLDDMGRELEWEASDHLIGIVIDRLKWKARTRLAISARYESVPRRDAAQ